MEMPSLDTDNTDTNNNNNSNKNNNTSDNTNLVSTNRIPVVIINDSEDEIDNTNKDGYDACYKCYLNPAKVKM